MRRRQIMKKATFFLSALALIFTHALISFAYETIGFVNGGSIEGTVEFSGDIIPRDKTFTISSDVRYCGREIQTEKYLINKEKKIKNVVVYLKNIAAGKAISKETMTITDSKCTFLPHVSLGFKGNKYIITNEDPVLHTIHVYARLGEKTMFNSALPERGSTITKTFTKTGVLEFNCDCHPWMESFIVVFDHPYAAITDEQGMFSIKDIPPGVYTVEAWHEALGTIKIEDVKVQSTKTSAIKLKYTSKQNLH
jgi:plastocyanin